ncbi:hypothetical protein XANMN_16655 [Xanthomonas phaseoli pv. manihotis str. CIO151]|nr:hypothetical protein XANMN_16655 [Xanthomonas phaseoli pv. manihotis str. CIO151]
MQQANTYKRQSTQTWRSSSRASARHVSNASAPQATSSTSCSACRLPTPDSRLPTPDSRDASITTHPVTQVTCNRLQAFREGMCTTFVAILSFSPAAATGTT